MISKSGFTISLYNNQITDNGFLLNSPNFQTPRARFYANTSPMKYGDPPVGQPVATNLNFIHTSQAASSSARIPKHRINLIHRGIQRTT